MKPDYQKDILSRGRCKRLILVDLSRHETDIAPVRDMNPCR
jgi:hypothetical protein